MGKYDHITKEQLEELYIKRNLSKHEIREILGISETHCGRLLKKYNITKTAEQYKALQSRIAYNINQNLSPEKRQSRIDKCRKSSLNNVNVINMLKTINKQRSLEHQRKLTESWHKFMDNETEEHKQARIKAVSEGTKRAMQALPDERKQDIINKRNLSIARHTPEQKLARLQKLRKTWSEKSQDEKTAIYIKQSESRIKNGSFQSSKGEKELKDFVESFGFKTERLVCGAGDTRFELDIYIPELKIAIEYNGIYYHSCNGINKRSKSYHYTKSKYAAELGISLIHVWEDLWNTKKDLIKTIIMSRLGVLTQNKVYARQCELREIDTKTYKSFCEINHIQGYRPASIKLGLFFKDELVQIASFGKIRNIGKQNRIEEWEWIRGCPASLNSVVGGTSKLFSYFVKNYSPESILCYADWNLFDGKGYVECGFIFDGYTGPDKFFVKAKENKTRISRNPYKYREHKELVANNTLFECYGAGSKRFIWYKNS
jgi:hypothetical protein